MSVINILYIFSCRLAKHDRQSVKQLIKLQWPYYDLTFFINTDVPAPPTQVQQNILVPPQASRPTSLPLSSVVQHTDKTHGDRCIKSEGDSSPPPRSLCQDRATVSMVSNLATRLLLPHIQYIAPFFSLSSHVYTLLKTTFCSLL